MKTFLSSNIFTILSVFIDFLCLFMVFLQIICIYLYRQAYKVPFKKCEKHVFYGRYFVLALCYELVKFDKRLVF